MFDDGDPVIPRGVFKPTMGGEDLVYFAECSYDSFDAMGRPARSEARAPALASENAMSTGVAEFYDPSNTHWEGRDNCHVVPVPYGQQLRKVVLYDQTGAPLAADVERATGLCTLVRPRTAVPIANMTCTYAAAADEPEPTL